MNQFSPNPENSQLTAPDESGLTESVGLDLPENEPFRSLAIRFIGRLKDRLEEFDGAIRQHNFEKIMELAHWVKGTSGSVGLKKLSSLAAQLEVASRSFSATDVKSIFTLMCEAIGCENKDFDLVMCQTSS